MLSERNQVSHELAFLTKYSDDDELSILSRALDIGLEMLFRQTAEQAYVDEKLERLDAIEILGENRIQEIDYALQALTEDIVGGWQG